MKILLAGYNLDYDLIKELKDKSNTAQDLTPETISAAYARISRSPKPVDELRALARSEVEKARKSNRNIVFDMGHSSVAEHAVFNIDVIGASRLLIEEIEKFRLCSYTEKSQRYVLFNKDFVVPEEIKKAGLSELFAAAIGRQNDYYRELYAKLRPYVFAENKALAANPANNSLLEGWAKEDARYTIALATETQLGMTINARNLELMLRRLAGMPLAEAREYSGKLYAATKDIAPSLIRYTEATEYDRLTRVGLQRHAAVLAGKYPQEDGIKKNPAVQLSFATPEADNKAAAALLFASSGLAYGQCLVLAAGLASSEKKALFKTAFEHGKAHDAALRELENVDLQFELILSASCFAQLKRHRMATIVSQDYDPGLGVTIPPAICAIGQEKQFREIMRRTQDAYEQIRKKAPLAAPYVLTNAHRKRVLMKFNARELYHLARLRADGHAQWDIRRLSEEMLKKAKIVMPLTLLLACGKDSFAVHYKKNFPHN
ncbi:MAG: thymidylate synthase (FAD) [Deltaproteobacteria bacterium HGW-Deltaproteobacteria-12]|jgi:flavin-dependent thymidylate synthase|nr:MAG: thymidylate synthase (FAD) [Deltaproteobacteria bacterium HGW-Deltaproteobacteria-12]